MRLNNNNIIYNAHSIEKSRIGGDFLVTFNGYHGSKMHRF